MTEHPPECDGKSTRDRVAGLGSGSKDPEAPCRAGTLRLSGKNCSSGMQRDCEESQGTRYRDVRSNDETVREWPASITGVGDIALISREGCFLRYHRPWMHKFLRKDAATACIRSVTCNILDTL